MSKQWRASSNGPDWTDCHVYLREVEKTHECTCYVGMQPIGGRNAFEWGVNVVAVLMKLDETGRQVISGRSGSFPHRDHATLEGLVFALIARVDWDLGAEQYSQSSFFDIA